MCIRRLLTALGHRLRYDGRLHDRFFLQAIFDAGNELEQRDGSTASNVEDPPRGRAGCRVWSARVPVAISSCRCIQGAKNAFDDVIDVGEVSSLLPSTEDLYGLILQD